MGSSIPKKSLGQHWLDDPASLAAICAAGDVSRQDTVLEIGPGLGSLTRLLVRAAQNVVAVEFDELLSLQLPQRVVADNLEVVHEDILRFDFSSLPGDYKVIANIPYYLTSNLLRVLSEAENSPQKVVLLIQKEVAERVVAGSDSMSLLSVSAQFYWEVSLGQVVKAELFTPPPKVDSQILIMRHRPQPLFADIDTKQLFRIVKAGFSGRRKTLLNSLSAGLQLEKPQTRDMLEKAGVVPTLRAQNLSLEGWHDIYQAYLHPDSQTNISDS